MKLSIGFLFCVIGAAMLAVPNMTRRGILFGFAVRPGFRESAGGRRSVTEFRVLVVAALIAVLSAIFFAPAKLFEPVSVAGPLIIVAAALIGFVLEHRRIAPFATNPLSQREAEISSVPDKLPWFVWLVAGPFLILVAAIVFMSLNWNRIPLVFPVHWSVDGQPNRWNHRDFHGVYGPLLFGAELCAWMLIMAVAIWFGARRSRFRRISFGGLIACEYMMAFLFTALSLRTLVPVPIWLIVAGPLVFIVPLLIVMARDVADAGEVVEMTPNESWKAGMIYFNRNDPALFVQKRSGLGYTWNFGNRWSWMLALGLVLIIGTIPLLM